MDGKISGLETKKGAVGKIMYHAHDSGSVRDDDGITDMRGPMSGADLGGE